MAARLCTPSGARRSSALALVAAASLCAFATCGAPAPPERPNVVVVLVDTLRADRLSLYGYERKTSPRLDRFAAARGVVFANAWANAGCTFPSANSLLTGVWPQRFLDRLEEHGMSIPPSLPSLAERFAAGGYDTAAVSASSIVRKTPSAVNKRGGFDRGFAAFDESCLTEPASCVNERAFERLDHLREPYFLYLHYFDPHHPYQPPAGAARTFSRRSKQRARPWARRGRPEPIQNRLYNGKKVEFDADDVRHLSNLYDDEVRNFDTRFGELVAELERRGDIENTVLVVLADHGEELYENRNWGHCRNLAFDTILGTPLVIAAPGTEPGRRDQQVSNVDLAPTLLELAGIPFDPLEFDGRSVASALRRDGPLESRFSFAAQGGVRAATDGRRVARYNLRDGKLEIAPLRRGTDGTTSTAPTDPEVVALRRALFDWIRRLDREIEGGASVRRADEVERELRAVGYL